MGIAALFVLTAGKAMAAPAIETEPISVNFGQRTVDQSYSNRYVDIYGLDEAGVEVTDFQLHGTDADDFEVADANCSGSEVFPDSPCYLLVNFIPSEVGARTASLEIEASEGDPVTVPLSGMGAEIPDNVPDLSAPILNPALTDTSDLWGFAGGDFEGVGRSGVVTVSQMEDWSVSAGFANGQASGILTEPVGREISAGGFAGDAATGDFNDDGELDAAASGGGGVNVYFNEGSGVMSAGTPLDGSLDGSYDRITTGNFDDDEIDDILTGYNTFDENDDPAFMSEIYAGSDDGEFAAPVTQLLPDVDTPMGIASGDFDGDEYTDFAISTYPGPVIMYKGGSSGFTEIGRFNSPCGCQSPEGITTSDLNGDGRDDVVAAMRFEDELVPYLAQSDGTFVRGQRIPIPFTDGWNPNPYAVSAGDLNGDDHPDLITGNYLTDTVSVFVGHGDGTFDFGETLPTDPDEMFLPHGTFIGDFNGDGKPDPSSAGQVGTVAVYLNEGEPGQVPVPASLDLGEAESGTTSAPMKVELENQGGLAKLVVDQAAIGGGASSDFEIQSQTCGQAPIPVGGSCELQIVFDPTGPPGERTSTLYLGTNHSVDTQVQVPLSGEVVEPPPPAPGISIDPTAHDYGSLEVGSTSAAKAFTVTSSGEEPLTISQVTIAGTGAAEFKSAANGCVGTFAPGAKCVISLEFAPTSAGAKSATVQFAANAPGAPGTIGLSGTATAAPVVKPPKVVIKKRPRATIRIRTRVLKQTRVAFRANQSGSKFRCRVDKKKFRACKPPLILRKVKPGRHVVRIQAIKAGKKGPVKVIKFRVVRRR